MNEHISKMAAATREPQYGQCFEAAPLTFGPTLSWTHERNPFHLGFTLSRYKNVARMLTGKGSVAEIGCGDGDGAKLVRHMVKEVDLFDFDPLFAQRIGGITWDILDGPLWMRRPGHLYDAIYALDVLEHIRPEDEPRAMANIVSSLKADSGVFIAGCPSLESQAYAAPISKAGHVNCKTGEKFREDALRFFTNVFLFGMNDEVLTTGFPAMCHYLLVLCTGPRKQPAAVPPCP